MRVVDCECGMIVQAGNDDDLVDRIRDHLKEDHPDRELSDDELRALVADRVYEATDS